MTTYQKATLVLMVLIVLNLFYISFMLSPGGGTRWPPAGSAEAVSGSIPKAEEALTIPNHLQYLACGMNYLVESEILRARREAERDAATSDRQPSGEPEGEQQ